MIEIITGILLLISAIVVLVASVGIVRFRDLYARMHVVTKVSSFGLLLLLIAVNLYFRNFKILLESIIVFHVLIFLSPISAHVIAKITTWMEADKSKKSKPDNTGDENV